MEEININQEVDKLRTNLLLMKNSIADGKVTGPELLKVINRAKKYLADSKEWIESSKEAMSEKQYNMLSAKNRELQDSIEEAKKNLPPIYLRPSEFLEKYRDLNAPPSVFANMFLTELKRAVYWKDYEMAELWIKNIEWVNSKNKEDATAINYQVGIMKGIVEGVID